MKIGPKYKIARRLGADVFEKTQTQKFALSEARKGKSSKSKRPKTLTDYGKQMRNKQRVRLSYRISEKQFGNYIKAAMAKKGVNSAQKLYEDLESRLDNIVYRSGFAITRGLARQMVSHGHIDVNGRRVTIPSYRTSAGDKITIRERSRTKPLFNELEKNIAASNTPAWLKFDSEKKEVSVSGKPVNTEVALDLNSVIEFYSR
jgi:small subunit ribosomal protein S4